LRVIDQVGEQDLGAWASGWHRMACVVDDLDHDNVLGDL